MKKVTVTITKGKHKSQPYTFTIDKPGPAAKETKRTRYARKFTAKRGAIRQLDAWKDIYSASWHCLVRGRKYSEVATVKFIDNTGHK